MTEVPKPPDLAGRGGVWFRAGALELHLGVEDDFRPAGKAHPGLLVADLPAYVDGLAAHGVPVEWDDAFPGYRRCYLRDPYGNRLELLEPLPA
jgi:catechol 2,3-dioxygenase-like lactoylglutathione lyase family enzyme